MHMYLYNYRYTDTDKDVLGRRIFRLLNDEGVNSMQSNDQSAAIKKLFNMSRSTLEKVRKGE